MRVLDFLAERQMQLVFKIQIGTKPNKKIKHVRFIAMN